MWEAGAGGPLWVPGQPERLHRETLGDWDCRTRSGWRTPQTPSQNQTEVKGSTLINSNISCFCNSQRTDTEKASLLQAPGLLTCKASHSWIVNPWEYLYQFCELTAFSSTMSTLWELEQTCFMYFLINSHSASHQLVLKFSSAVK